MPSTPPGLDDALNYPLWEALFNRRSRRVARGAGFRSGALTFASTHPAQPLSRLEEALLIVATGVTGLALADNPYQTEAGAPLLGTPLLAVGGRSAGSPDNAQSTHFFMWNDEGTYFLRPADGDQAPDAKALTPDDLIAYAERFKVRIKDGRLEFPRAFPAYASGNRYVSNVPGSTMFVPVTEVTRQYINGLMYVLDQGPGSRPMFVDDYSFYMPCGCEKWVKSGFLNRGLPLPLSLYGKGRTEYESLLLLQNLALVGQAMGLGGWIHAAFAPALLFGGYPDLGAGLGFRFVQPKFSNLPLPIHPYPASAPNPVGLDGVLQAYCPPYFESMDKAIDTILAEKYGPKGCYADPAHFGRVLRPGVNERFLAEASRPDEGVVDCVRAICNYILHQYGRFPAHCHAIDSAGVWMQFHHLDTDFYDRFFLDGYSRAQREHQARWHS